MELTFFVRSLDGAKRADAALARSQLSEQVRHERDSGMNGMRRVGLVAGALAAAWLAGGGDAAAQNPPAFPATLDRDTLLNWLKRETDITPERVVAVTPQALTAVVSTFPGGGGQPPRVVIRAEALDPDTYAQTGALSWHVSISADCERRRIRLSETTGYDQRNLLGERKPIRAAESDWRTAPPGTALELAWRAACEPGFRGPLHGEGVKMAQVEPAPAPSPARSEPAAAAASAPAPTGAVVQVGAAPTEAEAWKLLGALGARLEGREAWVESATVGGRLWRRALVGGFADRAAAARFCAALKSGGRDCFVRDRRD